MLELELKDLFPTSLLPAPPDPFPLWRRGPLLQPVFFSLTTIYVPDNSTHHRAKVPTIALTDQLNRQPLTPPLKVIKAMFPRKVPGLCLLVPELAGQPNQDLNPTTKWAKYHRGNFLKNGCS